MKCDFLIIGSGLAGSVFAERIASKLNKKVIVIEKRNHIGGNAYDEYDDHGILIHRYGPHIFHTNSTEVFEYLSKFTEWRHYEHAVLARHKNDLYPIPINRITINKIFSQKLSTDQEVGEFLRTLRVNRFPIMNSEDIIVSQVGEELYNIFFKHYTKKQWELHPRELAPSVCGRIPVRFNDDCRYFTDNYQYMPVEGYTKMFERMLSHNNIEIILNTDYKDVIENIKYHKLIYTGPIDYFFNYKFGKLPYRSINFEYEYFKTEFYQKTAQINYVDPEIKFTRVLEHKRLSGQTVKGTTISREYPTFEGEPYYPIPNEFNRKQFLLYKLEADKLSDVVFCGRLAEYQYYNMDQVVANTLKLFHKKFLDE